MTENIKRITLRIPESLHQQLTKVAEENKRSINNEILFMIEQVIKESKK
ncbi:Arc family DNA-binding protein [Bacillus sonorensis]|nr:Arc family DNA-binding protein [Bacillus sonorensis]MEC1437223.1 Arc family DNA-binding protein [Bacillus sonorensis]